MIEKIKTFAAEVSREMKKVSWPTKEQLKESTMVTLVATTIFTLFVWAIDWVMQNAMKFVFASF